MVRWTCVDFSAIVREAGTLFQMETGFANACVVQGQCLSNSSPPIIYLQIPPYQGNLFCPWRV